MTKPLLSTLMLVLAASAGVMSAWSLRNVRHSANFSGG